MANTTPFNKWNLEGYYEYLKLLARLQLPSQFRQKFESSDLVQQTLLNAQKGLKDFRGSSEAEFKAWLRNILANHMQNEIQKYHTDKRDIKMEQSLQMNLEESSARLEAWVASSEASPSSEAMQNEELQKMAKALCRLPEEWRIAVELRYLQQYSLKEISEEMQRSKASVAGLLRRGLNELRLVLDEGI